MDTQDILRIDSLKSLHPSCDFYDRCVKSLVYRLAVEPTKLDESLTYRVVDVQHVPKDTKQSRVCSFIISWSGCSEIDSDNLDRHRRTSDSKRVTEDAAIGMMAILIWELEKAEVVDVREEGQGGDYDIVKLPSGEKSQIEVSGIGVECLSPMLEARIKIKSDSVVKHPPHAGFVSVTAFDYGHHRTVQSVMKFHRSETL